MLVARRFLVSGRVQGVGFRLFTVEAASVEGIHGWVANRSDGRVEVAAEGDQTAIERFARRLAQGPAGARVEQVESEEDVPSWRAHGFSIRA